MLAANRSMEASAKFDSPWERFDMVRDHLFDQWMEIPFDPESGLSVDELRAEVDAWLADHAHEPRVLQRAHAYRLVVSHAQIVVDPLDWFAAKLNHGGILRGIRARWQREAAAGPIEAEAAWCEQAESLGVCRAGIDLGHVSPGWENMFHAGLCGLIDEARAYGASLGTLATPEQLAFYEAVEIVYGATNQLAARYAAMARRLIPQHPEHAVRLTALADACEHVPAHAPRGFHEALQFSWLMHELIEMEGENVRSMGHFDRTLYPYYVHDIESGRLTRDQAKELIKFFWMKWFARTRGCENGKNFVFGGQDGAGNLIANDLTYVALEAYEELNAPDPKLSVRFLPKTPDELYRRVADLIRKGHNSFVLMNDAVAVQALVERGKTLSDARQYVPIGCYEPAVDGKEVGCTMNIIVNLAKGVELALHDGRDPLSGEQIGPHTGDPRGFQTFEELFNAYRVQMEAMVTAATANTAAHERAWPLINPSPLLAGTIDDCLALGKDVGQGGAHYNSVGCVGLGLGSACDSLLAVKRAVYGEGRLSMDALLALLARDFDGAEPVRLYLRNKTPKWGNNDAEADEIARRIADHYCAFVHTRKNGRGGGCQAALFSLDHRVDFGFATGATPDGRKARTSLSAGVGAMTGMDKNGVTSLIGSVTKLDFTQTPNGSVLDVMLHPSAITGDDGLDIFVALIKTFFQQGGYAIQFNVVSPDQLRDAQLHPEQYANLQIRVTGWSVFFTSLSREAQDHFIAQIAHEL